jgi:hypothetical protein|tara:strand:- start:152 stop:643 length:492 start_codon:yes stop_codon:yes gene_type:complete
MIAQRPQKTRSLLSGNTEGLTASTGGLGSLSSNLVSPVMSETSMVLGLSHSLKILSHHGIEIVGDKLGPATVLWVLLSVEEPFWDVVVNWSSDDVVNSLDLFLVHLSGSFVAVNLSDFEDEDGESSTETSDLSKTEWSLLFTVDVCVLDSKNVNELVWVLQYQ